MKARGLVHLIVDRARALDAPGIVHVRNKQADAGELLTISRYYQAQGRTVLINSRVDVAVAAGAAGVHLPSGSISPARWRSIAPAGFIIGVSCHTREDLERAQAEGADYAYLSPIFAPLSKSDDRPPLGLPGFQQLIAGLTMPVLALGGITWAHQAACEAAGAAGIAGISLSEGSAQRGG
ncbi:MAG: thiamine phosphate synthase [Acidobacteria bacterium]|nr:thiamine phosphate synthase [Acidobacteriota bacterium]